MNIFEIKEHLFDHELINNSKGYTILLNNKGNLVVNKPGERAKHATYQDLLDSSWQVTKHNNNMELK